jgi:phage-related protein
MQITLSREDVAHAIQQYVEKKFPHFTVGDIAIGIRHGAIQNARVEVKERK